MRGVLRGICAELELQVWQDTLRPGTVRCPRASLEGPGLMGGPTSAEV